MNGHSYLIDHWSLVVKQKAMHGEHLLFSGMKRKIVDVGRNRIPIYSVVVVTGIMLSG
jgi:hypothetical protein